MKKIVLKSLPRRARDTPQPKPQPQPQKAPEKAPSDSASATEKAGAEKDSEKTGAEKGSEKAGAASAGADAVVVEKPPADGLVVLRELQAAARRAGLTFSMVADAGRTQIDPGSITVIGVFGPGSRVDQITGHLALL